MNCLASAMAVEFFDAAEVSAGRNFIAFCAADAVPVRPFGEHEHFQSRLAARPAATGDRNYEHPDYQRRECGWSARGEQRTLTRRRVGRAG